MTRLNKKMIFLIVFTLLTLFIKNGYISAETKTFEDPNYEGKYEYNDENQAVYCGKKDGFFKDMTLANVSFSIYDLNIKDFKYCMIVSKPSKATDNEGRVMFDSVLTLPLDTKVPVLLYTAAGDPVVQEQNKWWKNIYLCYTTDGFSTRNLSLYTDSLDLKTLEDSGWIIGGSSSCVQMNAETVNKNNLVSYCNQLNTRFTRMQTLATKYNKSNSPIYVTQYRKLIDEVRGLCTQISKFANYDDSCMDNCRELENDIYEMNKKFGIDDSSGACGFSGRLIHWVLNILRWIKYIIPVVVILLGSIDFIKATGSDKDDDMKKAQGNLVKRLIAAALLFLIPLLIEFILPKFGFDYNGCGIF